jgi:hypothetical protein
MDQDIVEPPSFLGYDTSNQQAKRIPCLILGYPKLLEQAPKKVYVATIRKRERERDISGHQSMSNC